jgi:hypothetical protein
MMADGRGEFEWNQTASIESLIINMNRKEGSKAVHPDELNPYVKKSERRKKNTTLSGAVAWDYFRHVVESGALARVAKKQ